MAVTYGFYNSVNGDRKYNAEQMAQIFDGIINDGVFSSVGTAFKVTPSSGMIISVGAGRAWFNHTWTYNDAAITLTVSTAPAGTLSRIDAVVIEVDVNNRVNTIKIVEGTQAESPVRPALVNTEGVHQYALAYITVAAGTTVITSAMIASVVGTDTPFVTGPLETVGVTGLYDYWRAEFETWFEHLQDELDSNQAANLQHQIDDLNSAKADKAEVDAAIADIYKVGDIKSTVRSTLGDKWALANGDFITDSEAPDYTSQNAKTFYYQGYNLPDIGDVPAICFASTIDEDTGVIYALGGVPKLVGSINDSHSTAWDIWLFKSIDYGASWSALYNWYEARPRYLSSTAYYTATVSRNVSNMQSYASTLYTHLVVAFKFYKGIVLWLRPWREDSISTTGSSYTTVYDSLAYYNGVRSIDITDQYKNYLNITSIANSDYLYAAYETEIDTSQTKGLLLFIGTYTRLFFLGITVSGNVATVSGRLAYGSSTNVANVNPDNVARSVPANAHYIHNIRSIIKIPNSNYSLIACGHSNSVATLTFGKLDCTRLFSTELVANDTYMVFSAASNNVVMNDVCTYANKDWINVGTGAVYVCTYGSSSSWYTLYIYFTWTAVLNWTTTTYWNTNTYKKSTSAASSGEAAIAQICPLGWILSSTPESDGSLLCVCTDGIGKLSWDTSTWMFTVLSSIITYNDSGLDFIYWIKTSELNRWITKFHLYTYSDGAFIIPDTYKPYYSAYDDNAPIGQYSRGSFLPHVDAVYQFMNANSAFAYLDGITNTFVKIKE